MINMTAIIGKPMNWNTLNYGTIAVHIMGISPNGKVYQVSIDGLPGGGFNNAQNSHGELSDGIGFATMDQLSKRAPQVRNARLGILRKEARELGMSTALKLSKVSDLEAAIAAFKAKGEETF